MFVVTIAVVGRFFTTVLQEVEFEEECQARFFAATWSAKNWWALLSVNGKVKLYEYGKEQVND